MLPSTGPTQAPRKKGPCRPDLGPRCFPVRPPFSGDSTLAKRTTNLQPIKCLPKPRLSVILNKTPFLRVISAVEDGVWPGRLEGSSCASLPEKTQVDGDKRQSPPHCGGGNTICAYC